MTLMRMALRRGLLHLRILRFQNPRHFDEILFHKYFTAFCVPDFVMETENLGILKLLEHFQSQDHHAEGCALYAVFTTFHNHAVPLYVITFFCDFCLSWIETVDNNLIFEWGPIGKTIGRGMVLTNLEGNEPVRRKRRRTLKEPTKDVHWWNYFSEQAWSSGNTCGYSPFGVKFEPSKLC